jgi:hypothetical protein
MVDEPMTTTRRTMTELAGGLKATLATDVPEIGTSL